MRVERNDWIGSGGRLLYTGKKGSSEGVTFELKAVRTFLVVGIAGTKALRQA